MDTNTIALIQTVALFLALFGFWWKLDAKIEKVREASEDAHKAINDKLNAIQVTQATHSEKFNTVDEKFNTMGERFNKVDERLNKVDQRLNKVDARFDKVDERFDKVDDQFNTIQTQIKSVDEKVDRLRNN